MKKKPIWITDPNIANLMVNDKDKNLSRGSDKKVQFKCENHPEPYVASVGAVVRGTRCTYCRGQKTLIGFNDLATTHPEHSRQLFYENDGLKYRGRSDAILLWKCSKHPLIPYKCSVSNKIIGRGCGVCRGYQLAVGFNDLWTVEPELSQELLDPNDGFKYTRGSGKKVWWVCPEGHIWETAICARTGSSKTGCKECSGKKSRSEVYLAEVELKSEIVETQKYIKPEGWVRGFFPDIYLPEYDTYIEYDGCLWHSSEEKIHYDIRKTNYLLGAGSKVVRLREVKNKKHPLKPLPIDHNNLLQIMVNYSGDMKFLDGIWKEIQEWI